MAYSTLNCAMLIVCFAFFTVVEGRRTDLLLWTSAHGLSRLGERILRSALRATDCMVAVPEHDDKYGSQLP